MNLIELENLVKGAPDEYLTKEVKQPTGKIPPFLALSEIQRRKDMRDRYMAQKNEGAKPTIAEQLTGGIGSLGGAQAPQGAPVPTPSATGIPSAGAPPVASGAAPMPTPPGQPQGFAAGGQVGYADGGGVAVNPRMKEILQALEADKRIKEPGFGGAGLRMFQEQRMPLGLAQRMQMEKELARLQSAQASALTAAMDNPVAPPSPVAQTATPLLNFTPRADVPVASPSAPVPASARPGPLPAPAPAGGAGGYTATAGGIGSIDPNQALAGPAPSGGAAPAAGIPNPYNLSPEELSYQEFLKNDENFKLPEALSYQGFIDEAVGEEQAIRAEAKKQALGAALVQLGAGLAAGDMAKGLTTAGAESRDILSEGRREASAQKALAQQFKLRGMEGEREQRMKMLEIEQQRAMALAQFAGGNRRDAEARAMQIMEMKQRAADRAANLSVSLANQQMTRDRYALEAKKERVQLRSELLRATIGEPPSAKAMAEYQEQVTYRLDPKTGKPKPGVAIPPNPMTVYRELAAQVAPEVDRQVAEAFGEASYTPVAPVSNPPKDYTGFELLGTQNPKK